MTAKGSYFPAGVNCYVPNCMSAADVALEGRLLVDLTPDWAPLAANATGIMLAQSIATAGSSSTFVAGFSAQSEAQMGRFGRCINVVASGAAVSAFTVQGEDYLGQPMSETYTLTGTTPVAGKKAFRRVRGVTFGATGATTVNVGWTDSFGVPYAVIGNQTGIFSELIDGVQVAAGALTLQLLTAQSATSVDPRGIYTPTTLPNGVRRYKIYYEPNRMQLHGLRHFFA